MYFYFMYMYFLQYTIYYNIYNTFWYKIEKFNANILIMSMESIGKFILNINKWKNIQYYFNNKSNNCTLNIDIGNPVRD